MGDAKRRKTQIQAQHGQLSAAVEKVSFALRRLATAASGNLGGDCYLHAELGKALLADYGFSFKTVLGFAAWRVGPGDGDVLAHTAAVQGYLPPGSLGFPFHAWLESGDWLVDFTTYQFARKGRDLDAADGGHTQVNWRPDYLLIQRKDLKSYREVAQAPDAPMAYYEVRPELERPIREAGGLAPEDLATARLILLNPDMRVMGPNDIDTD